MRRKDREIKEIESITQILEKCDVCRISLFDAEYPYIIPLNFGHSYENKELSLYFHSAIEGKKLDLIKLNNKVAFEMDTSKKLIIGETPCNFTMEFESLCGNGEIEILANEDKIDGLKYIMKHYTDKDYENTDFDENEVKSTVVLKLKVNQISGKRLKIN